MRHKSLYQPTY